MNLEPEYRRSEASYPGATRSHHPVSRLNLSSRHHALKYRSRPQSNPTISESQFRSDNKHTLPYYPSDSSMVERRCNFLPFLNIVMPETLVRCQLGGLKLEKIALFLDFVVDGIVRRSGCAFAVLDPLTR